MAERQGSEDLRPVRGRKFLDQSKCNKKRNKTFLNEFRSDQYIELLMGEKIFLGEKRKHLIHMMNNFQFTKTQPTDFQHLQSKLEEIRDDEGRKLVTESLKALQQMKDSPEDHQKLNQRETLEN